MLHPSAPAETQSGEASSCALRAPSSEAKELSSEVNFTGVQDKKSKDGILGLPSGSRALGQQQATCSAPVPLPDSALLPFLSVLPDVWKGWTFPLTAGRGQTPRWERTETHRQRDHELLREWTFFTQALYGHRHPGNASHSCSRQQSRQEPGVPRAGTAPL